MKSHDRLWHLHPAVRTGDGLTIGERTADAAVRAMGSWRFLIIQTVFLAAWMTLNVVHLTVHWDGYPYTFLNLVLSTQAAYAAPLILLAGVRADTKRAEVAVHTLDNTTAMQALLHQLVTASGKAIHDDEAA